MAARLTVPAEALRTQLFRGRRGRLPVIRQAEIAECGLACLLMVSAWYGRPRSLQQCRAQGMTMPHGASLPMLREAASDLGFHSRALRVELESLAAFATPVILHWRMNHFVVLAQVSRRGLTIHDPALGRQRFSWAEADAAFTGVVLELTPQFTLQPTPPPPRLRLRDFARNLRGLGRGLVHLIALSLALQVVLLCAPLYSQLVVDDALLSGDQHLLAVLAGGFGLLVVLQVALQLLRGWLVVMLGTQLASGAGMALQQRLLRLPLGWFEARATGDVLSRFRSARPVTDVLVQGTALVFVDGVMALLALALMLSYSLQLALLVLASTALYTGIRLALYPRFRAAALAQVSSLAQQESLFLETLRGISTVKAFAIESLRAARWQRRYIDELNDGLRLARLQLGFVSLETLLFGLELVLLVYFGAHAVLGGTLTIGMLFALLAYRGQFVARATDLVQGLLEIRALDVHLERLADIVLAEPGPAGQALARLVTNPDRAASSKQGPDFDLDLENASAAASPHPACIALDGVAYQRGRYGGRVLHNVSLQLPAGHCVALSGASGCGKSTLLKVAMGLLPPTAGAVRVDGARLRGATLTSYRTCSAAVLQDDRLFAGSVLQNIALFAEQPDVERAAGCLAQVGLAEQSQAFPMGLATPVGELGGGLSGGQVQRLLLARALYAQPAYLFLDECTAHLDPVAAAAIHRLIAALPMTRLVISHDPDFLALADQVIVLS